MREAGIAEANGSILVQTEPNTVVNSAVELTYSGGARPSYVDEEFAMSMPASSTLRATADASVFGPVVAITSLSATSQRLQVECVSEKLGVKTARLTLPPRHTVFSRVCSGEDTATTGFVAAINAESKPVGATGISITSNTEPGSFAAFALVPHTTADDRYFSSTAFVDPASLKSAVTAFVGVPVGSSPLLPSGNYVPALTATNFSLQPVHLAVAYSRTPVSRSPVVSQQHPINIPPRSSITVELGNLEGSPDIQNSFLVTASAAPGDVLLKLVSRGDGALRQVELLPKDANELPNGGSHPWTLANGADSNLLLFNHSEKTQNYSVHMGGAGKVWEKLYSCNRWKP